MKLDNYQNIIFDKTIFQSSSKEKNKNYYFNIFSLSHGVINLEALLTTSQFNDSINIISTQIAKNIADAIALLKIFNLPINSEEFSLDDYKDQINNYQGYEINVLTYSSRISVAALNGIIKDNIKEGKELSQKSKLVMTNILYDIVIRTLHITKQIGLDINFILEKYTSEINSEK